MIYLVPVILIIFGIFYYDYLKVTKGRLFLYVLICLFLIIIAGFRYRVGGDTVQYENFFETLKPLNQIRARDFSDSRYAPGFIFLSSLGLTIYNDFLGPQLLIALIINTVFFNFIWKNTNHPFTCVLLYFVFLYFTLNMEVLREAIAVSIFLLSWPFFKKGNYIIYYLFIIIALFFHLSAFILLFLPLLNTRLFGWMFKFGKQTLIISVILFIIGVFIRSSFMEYIQIINVSQGMEELTNKYSKTGLVGKSFLNIGGIISTIVNYILYPCLAMYFLNKRKSISQETTEDIKSEEKITILNIYISVIAMNILIMSRYYNYFIIFSFLLISRWVFSNFEINKFKKIRLNWVYWIIIMIPLFGSLSYSYFFNNVNTSGTLKTYMIYYPYKDAISREKDMEREKVFKHVRRKKF